jgi:branched-chain amino acid transport system substrate-binding protein
MKLRNLGAFGVAALLAVSACSSTPAASSNPSTGPSTVPSAASKGTVKIGVELPLSGGEAPNGQPTLKGVTLAVNEANAKGGIGGYKLELTVKDDAVNGKNNPEQGAKNMTDLVADQAVIAVVGPYNSAVAKVQIPVSNDAGLLQCSPANTNEGLTKPEFGALTYRKNFPERINYIRVATTDDIQGPAGAAYAFSTLGKKSVLIIDDQTTFGKGVADNFEKEFVRLGGTVAQRVGAKPDTTNFVPILTAAKEKNPDVIFYGGVTTSGGGLMAKQTEQAGLILPIVGPDGIQDGSGEVTSSFISIAGAGAKDAHSTVAAIGEFPAKADFDARYKAAFAKDPDFKEPGAYSGPAYACAQVVLKSLEEAAKTATDMKTLREAVRAYATTAANSFDTVLGKTSFDKNGDNTQKFISFYKVDLTAKGGKGDWIFVKQQDFGTK